MHKEGRLKRFWNWFGPNPLWELVRFIGGSSIMTAVGRFFWLEYHRSPVDWLWLAALFSVGCTLAGLAVWKETKLKFKSSLSSEPNIEDPNQKLRDSFDTYNQNFYYKMGLQASNVLTPLQLDALTLVKELGDFLKALPDVAQPNQEDFERSAQGVANFLIAHHEAWRPREEAFEKLRAKYAYSLGPRVKDVVLRLRIEGCRTDPWLDHWFGDVPNEHILKPVVDTIVAMVHEVDGVKLSVTTYPRGK